MVSSESLRKILELEVKRGYANTAVMGGLDRFLRRNAPIIKSSIHDLEMAKRVAAALAPTPTYEIMDKPHRQAWVQATNRLLDEIERPPAAPSVTRVILKPKPLKPPPSPKQLKSPTSLKPPRSPESDRSETGAAVVSGKKAPVSVRTATPVTGLAGRKPSAGSLDSPVTAVAGISLGLQKKFEKLGVCTIRDLLYFFPHRHLDFSRRTYVNRLVIGGENTIIANVWQAQEVQLGLRRSSEATVGDETGNVRIVWFNQPYVAKALKTGQRIAVSGRVNVFNGMPVFESPEWEPYEDEDLTHTGRLVPVYPLTQGLGQRQVRRLLKPAVERWSTAIEDYVPQDIRQRLQLTELTEAIRQAHYPADETQKDCARRRIAFDELFLLQLGVLNKKRHWQQDRPGVPLETQQDEITAFLRALPFQLTAAQEKSLREICTDLRQSRPMSRLLQGEVGSGKTVVALTALLTAVVGGYQGAIMAPTEILAGQHFKTVRALLSRVGKEEEDGNICRYTGFLKKPLTVALLTGDLSGARKRHVRDEIVAGDVDIAIGTHAIIQKGIEFGRLALVVVDEQHRFGVEQRSALRQKGANPHVLVMTATPIPRTLALTLYGDLDLSIIDQLPPGRQVIKTKWLKPEQRERAYIFVREQIKAGRQAFIICPLVEESDAIQAKAATAEYERLSKEIFPDLRLGLLHGRMPATEKEAVMEEFHAGKLDILVSTPVVEVGIDVPNATVMLIESADRFGLSQLHQFRGRVGRGKEQSYCLLLAEKPSRIAECRLDSIERIHNGFLLAEEDLKLRGPGEFFGTRQSGLPDLKMARLSDTALLELARNAATKLFEADPTFQAPEHRLLAQEVARVWRVTSAELS